ncbi:MAG: DM13 domain-containing protein [Bacteroidota bacterium]
MKTPLKLLLGLLSIAVIAWLAFGFFGVQALFVDNVVDEDVPASISNLIDQDPAAPATPVQDSTGMAVADPSEPEEVLLGRGAFVQGDNTYTIAGDVFLSRTGGQTTLTFTDFEVTNGPDLFVYAVKTATTENTTVKATVGNDEFIDLGMLKGNIGTQNYVLEREFDPSEYQVITIWCKRFGRNFGSASLSVAS